MRRLFLFLMTVAGLAMSGGNLTPANAADASWRAKIPAPLIGPYVIDPETLAELDKSNPDCAKAGRLNFQCLVYQDDRSKMTKADSASNPFTLPVFRLVQKTVLKDLGSLADHEEFGGANAGGLKDGFLTYAGARIELVGVINRMDRQFNRDKVPNRGDQRLECGEISAIYRFAYEGNLSSGATGEQRYKSRLPVTMNVVFPARPWSKEVTCQDVAKRWLAYARSRQNGTDAALLLKQALLVTSTLKPQDIDRIELNMQGSRVPAQVDKTDFGTLGTYIIRVFRWAPNPNGGRWKPSYLSNQIDRSRLLLKRADENTCDEEKEKKITRDELVSYLLSMDTSEEGSNAIGDIDNGLLNIPQKFLACRAISISPGGASRSGNQPFWNAASPAEQIITDDEIDAALDRYKKKSFRLAYVRSADEFRTRLNEASCSGCHQTRAIAGFHFPGEDRPGASPVNAVYLPGSPHFFGDQLRRMEILEGIAGGKTLKFPELAASYAGRPLNRFKALRPDNVPEAPPDEKIQLIGGWGGTCLTGPRKATEVRDWGCDENLKCKAVFESANQPRIGMCLNASDQVQIGDPLQFGTVASKSFGNDLYQRVTPAIPDQPGKQRNTRIDTDKVKPPPPLDNSYVGAHQEFYKGEGGLDRDPTETAEQHAIRVRDQETGGFPAGALRLSECVKLFPEATCGLLASSGFNSCLTEVGEGKRTPDNCFGIYTSYAGVRACNAANPCRDDYICLRPMGYTAENAQSEFDARAARREAARNSPAEKKENRERLKITFFGEHRPDNAWLGRKDGNGDRRGLCIPPYFVFQFKADGHSVPKANAPSAGH